MKFRSSWICGMGFLALVPCCKSGSEGRARLKTEHSAWMKSRPTAYRFVYRMGYFGPGAGTRYEVHVRGRQVVSARPLDAVDPRPEAPAGGYPTVDQIFSWIRKAYDSNPDRIAVSFDSTYHYPVRADVDPMSNAVDDEWSIEILEFGPTK